MAFDGGFLHKMVSELNEAQNSHIDKIYQPSKHELVFLLRKKGFARKLYISLKPSGARIQFTENKPENPSVAPNFCMLLRKYLSSARLIGITQDGLERIATLNFSATNELGDLTNIKLICEFIGNQANAILVKEDGRIIDAVKRSDVETANRLILPNAVYELPPQTKNFNPLLCDANVICEKVYSKDAPISETLLSLLQGFSPLICREIEYLTEKFSLTNPKKNAFVSAFCTVLDDLKEAKKAVMLSRADGSAFEFSFTNINQYSNKYVITEFESYSALLDAFYLAKENASRISLASHNIAKLVTNLKNRTEKKLSLRLLELKKCENREKLRIYGELLKANLYAIENGSKKAVVSNYYDPELSLLEIPLNPALSVAKNAEKYFKDYKKTYTAEQTLTALTEQDKLEILYFDSVIDSINRATSISDIWEIKEELEKAGYIKKERNIKKVKTAVPDFNETTSPEGYRILVGKNNLQNDYITTHLASKSDLWFHVKGIPGSHVVVMCEGRAVSDQTILLAATLAAKNSKAANSSNVPVDYTQIKFVKKPSGAKPGMVIYTTNKTVFVTPNKETIL